MVAAGYALPSAVVLFIRYRADVDYSAEGGRSALHEVCIWGGGRKAEEVGGRGMRRKMRRQGKEGRRMSKEVIISILFSVI